MSFSDSFLTNSLFEITESEIYISDLSISNITCELNNHDLFIFYIEETHLKIDNYEFSNSNCY